MPQRLCASRRGSLLTAVVVTGFFVGSCGGTETAAKVGRTEPTTATNPPVSAPTAKADSGVSTYEPARLPAAFVEIRRKELSTPTGGTAHIRWYSASGPAPTLTTNLTTGRDVGLQALAEKRALAADLVAQSHQAGISLPPPTDIPIHDQPGIAYSDPLGWRSLFWVVDQDAVMSVTGLRFDDAQLQQIAEGVRFG